MTVTHNSLARQSHGFACRKVLPATQARFGTPQAHRLVLGFRLLEPGNNMQGMNPVSSHSTSVSVPPLTAALSAGFLSASTLSFLASGLTKSRETGACSALPAGSRCCQNLTWLADQLHCYTATLT